MVRAGNRNELISEFEEGGFVAVGWEHLKDLSDLETRRQVKTRYDEVFDGHSKNRRNVNAGQAYRFAHKIQDGDLVLSYDKARREYLVGIVQGSYEWNPRVAPAGYPHVRRVEWDERVPRDAFPTNVKNMLGATQTVFSLDEHLDKILRVVQGEEAPVEVEEDDDAPPYHEEVEGKADELISDQIARLDPYDFQDLVAAVLGAMGFETTVSPPGPDEGVDILAHPDDLGFESPVVKVQVKQRKSAAGASDMRSFIGTLEDGEKGLFVSTGGYTSQAEHRAKKKGSDLTILDRDEFIDLFIKHYDDIDPEHQALVPLKRVYVPTQE